MQPNYSMKQTKVVSQKLTKNQKKNLLIALIALGYNTQRKIYTSLEKIVPEQTPFKQESHINGFLKQLLISKEIIQISNKPNDIPDFYELTQNSKTKWTRDKYLESYRYWKKLIFPEEITDEREVLYSINYIEYYYKFWNDYGHKVSIFSQREIFQTPNDEKLIFILFKTWLEKHLKNIFSFAPNITKFDINSLEFTEKFINFLSLNLKILKGNITSKDLSHLEKVILKYNNTKDKSVLSKIDIQKIKELHSINNISKK